jgi:hypothetical protein
MAGVAVRNRRSYRELTERNIEAGNETDTVLDRQNGLDGGQAFG